MELIGRALKQVLFILDQVTYGLIPSAYELIFYLSNVNLFNNPVLAGVINRVYLLLGIYMLFKVAFSMIRFLIDPNAFDDKSKGFAKLVTNSLVAVVLLVMVPFLFKLAYQFQGDVILSNAIPRLILGDSEYVDYLGNKQYNPNQKITIDEETVKKRRNEIHSIGVDVQFAMFSAFYTLNTNDEINGFPSCKPTNDHPISNVLGSSDMINTDCWTDVQGPLTEELHAQGGTLTEIFKYKASKTKISDEPCSKGICDERDFAGFGKLLWWAKAGGNSPSTIVYIPIISAIAGGYLLLLLITFAIDIATRVFKLLFLQAIAPIAIISYMDPTESTTNGKFHNWLTECGKTYVSLFLRLAVIYLAILLIRIITSSVFAATSDSGSIYYDGMAPTETMNMFVYVFLILGIFTFAKKVPQMIEGIFNIKMSGEMNLNPFKAGTPLGTLAGGAVGAGLGSIAGAGANFLAGTRKNRESIIEGFKAGNKEGGLLYGLEGAHNAFKNNAENLFIKGKGLEVAKSTLKGNVSGGFVGGKSGIKVGKPSYSSIKQGKNAAIRGRQLKEQGYGVAARVEQIYNQSIGYRGTAAETGIGNELKQAKQEQQNWNAQEEQIRNTIATHAANYKNGRYASQIQLVTRTKQQRNKNGDLEEQRVFSNYNDFIDKQTAAKIVKDDKGNKKDVGDITTNDIVSAQSNKLIWDQTKKDVIVNAIGEPEFNNIASMVDQQIYASSEANKLESTIKKLESGKANFNEKPKA